MLPAEAMADRRQEAEVDEVVKMSVEERWQAPWLWRFAGMCKSWKAAVMRAICLQMKAFFASADNSQSELSLTGASQLWLSDLRDH